jgi:hypothetical protein
MHFMGIFCAWSLVNGVDYSFIGGVERLPK